MRDVADSQTCAMDRPHGRGHGRRHSQSRAPSSPPPSPTLLEALIDDLDERALRSILLAAAHSHLDVAQRIASSWRTPPPPPPEAERRGDNPPESPSPPRIEDFGHYIDEANHLLYRKYARLRLGQQFGIGFDVASDIEGMFKTMAERCVQASFCSRLHVLHKMCALVGLVENADGEVGRAVHLDANRFS